MSLVLQTKKTEQTFGLILNLALVLFRNACTLSMCMHT